MLDTPISRIDGLLDADRTVLANRQLSSTVKIWKALKDQESLLDTLGLSDDAKIRIRAALAAQAKKESASITRNRFVAHLPDLLVLAFFSLVISAAVFRDRRPQQAVIAAKAIAPFRVINATDIQVRNATDPAAEKQAAGKYVGRYAKTQVSVGERMETANLSSGMPLTNELDGLRVFAVKIRPAPILTGVPHPLKLDLFLSPRSTAERGRAHSITVYVLDSKSDGDNLWAVIAATEDDSTSLLSALSAGDLVAVGTPR